MKFFERKLGPIKLWWFIAVWAALAIGIIVGTFLDLDISNAIAGDTWIAKFGESFGEMLGYAIGPAAGAMIFVGFVRKERTWWIKAIGIITAIASIGITTYFAASNCSGQPGYSWTYDKMYGYIIAGVWSLCWFVITYFAIDKTVNADELALKGFVIAAAFGITLISVNFILKKLGYRPRYRAMVWGNETYGAYPMGIEHYRNWYEFGFYKKPDWFLNYVANNPTVNEHTLNDFIKSWPSGHSCCAALTLMFPLVLSVTKLSKHKKTASISFIAACVYATFIMLLRIMRGAHFLSDVCWGALVSALVIPAVYGLTKIFLKKNSKLSLDLFEKE